MTPSSNRQPPPFVAPQTARAGTGMPSKRHRDINVMLKDLGFLRGPITSHYTQDTRTGVSLLQQQLAADGFYKAPPHGNFDSTTRAALIADPRYRTTEDAPEPEEPTEVAEAPAPGEPTTPDPGEPEKRAKKTSKTGDE